VKSIGMSSLRLCGGFRFDRERSGYAGMLNGDQHHRGQTLALFAGHSYFFCESGPIRLSHLAIQCGIDEKRRVALRSEPTSGQFSGVGQPPSFQQRQNVQADSGERLFTSSPNRFPFDGPRWEVSAHEAELQQVVDTWEGTGRTEFVGSKPAGKVEGDSWLILKEPDSGRSKVRGFLPGLAVIDTILIPLPRVD
jgi:hypothetical protein